MLFLLKAMNTMQNTCEYRRPATQKSLAGTHPGFSAKMRVLICLLAIRANANILFTIMSNKQQMTDALKKYILLNVRASTKLLSIALC